MALTKVSGPLLHGSNDNLGNYVINNITGAAATFSSVSVGGTLTYDDVTNVDSVGIVTARGGLHVGVGGTIINAMPEDNGSLGIGQSIFHIGDTDTNFGFDSDNQIVFNAGGNEKLKVDSSGNVYFAGNRSGNDRGIIYNDSNGFGIYGSSSGTNHRNIIFFSSSSGSSEKVRITSGGSVAIGTDGAVSETKLDVLGNVVFGPRQHTGNPGNNTGIASIRGHFVNAAGDFAQLYFSNSESSGGGTGAKALISGIRDGVAGSNYGAGLAFHTEHRDPSTYSPKLRMLISGLGVIGINTNGPTAYFDIATNAGTYDNLRLRRIDSGSNGNSDWSLKPYGGNLFFRTGGATDKIIFTDGGKVGINTDATSHSLMVYDATESIFRIATTGVLAYDHTFDGTTYEIKNNNGSAGIPLIIGTKTSGGESLRIDASGRLLIGNTTNNGDNIGDGMLQVYVSDRKHPAIRVNAGNSNGYTLLSDAYKTDESQVNFGISYSAAALVLSTSVKPSDTADNTFLSSQDTFAARPCALTMNHNGVLEFLNTSTSATTTTDTAVTLSKRLTITRDGEMLLGTGGADRPIAAQRFNSASGWSGTLQIEKQNPNTGNNNVPIVAITAWNGANEQYTGGISFNRSNNNTNGTHGAVTTSQQLGNIAFNGSDGTNFIQGAEIFAIPDETFATNDGPASLVFATTPDGTSEDEPQERLKIQSDGKVKIGGGDASLALLHVAPADYSLNLQNNSSNKSMILFTKNGTPNDARSWIEGNGELNGYLAFAAGDNERLRITSSGVVATAGFSTSFGRIQRTYGPSTVSGSSGGGTTTRNVTTEAVGKKIGGGTLVINAFRTSDPTKCTTIYYDFQLRGGGTNGNRSNERVVTHNSGVNVGVTDITEGFRFTNNESFTVTMTATYDLTGEL